MAGTVSACPSSAQHQWVYAYHDVTTAGTADVTINIYPCYTSSGGTYYGDNANSWHAPAVVITQSASRTNTLIAQAAKWGDWNANARYHSWWVDWPFVWFPASGGLAHYPRLDIFNDGTAPKCSDGQLARGARFVTCYRAI